MGKSHTGCKKATLIKSSVRSCYRSQMQLMGSYRSVRPPHMWRTAFTACMLGSLLILSSGKPTMAYINYGGKAHLHDVRRVSTSDLDARHALERTIQLSAFGQFHRKRSGRLYNISVSTITSGTFQVIRLRSGSFRRYGVNISEFSIPRGCVVNPNPERVLLVYAKLINTSLFDNLPGGLVLASPVVSVLVYDASNLSSSDRPQQLSVSATESPISIHIAQSPTSKCIYFDDVSTNVNITNPLEGACSTDHLGSFALANSTSVQAPSPIIAQSPASTFRKRHSNTWKIVLGSVIGGLALLVLCSLLAWGMGKRRKTTRIKRMEYQADQGETLQMTTVGSSRVPTAADSRTQPRLENEYSV